MPTALVWVAVVAFPVSEILLGLFKRASRESATDEDRGSMRVIWIVVSCGIAAGVALQNVRLGRLPVRSPILYSIAFALLAAGLVLRWVAILTLGRLFTVNVAIHDEHPVVDTGVYRYIRHPSYTGLLTAFLGLGVFFQSWISILVVFVPASLAVLNRIRKEEAALRRALGKAYEDYCRRTRRLVPGIL